MNIISKTFNKLIIGKYFSHKELNSTIQKLQIDDKTFNKDIVERNTEIDNGHFR